MFVTILFRFGPLLLLVLLFLLFYFLGLHQYLSFDALQLHHEKLMLWTSQHYFLTVLIYMLIYIICVAASIPGALILSLTGGFLFGTIWGTLFIIMSATIGSTLVFCIIKFALSDWVDKRTSKWVRKMRQGFNHNAFSYLLILRLLPIFPFWAVNIVPALLGVSVKTFISATFLGIIPGSLIYSSIGNSLNQILDSGQKPDLKIIFSPEILLPLLGLALLSTLPILYKKFKGPYE